MPVAELATRMKDVCYRRWHKAAVLIITEISLVPAALLDEVDQLGRVVRGMPAQPFGGLRVILCGDFLEMPPVAQDGRLAFRAAVWDALRLRTITLPRRGTGPWAELLERARHGALAAADIAALRTRELACPSATAARLQVWAAILGQLL
jgi:ATP-dependent DNA helicase PIF1